MTIFVPGKTLTIHDLTAVSCNNVQHDGKIKVLVTVIIALLFRNSRLMLCQIFSYDFPKIINLPKIFLRSFENVTPVYYIHTCNCFLSTIDRVTLWPYVMQADCNMEEDQELVNHIITLRLSAILLCESKNPPLRFSEIFSQTVGNF